MLIFYRISVRACGRTVQQGAQPRELTQVNDRSGRQPHAGTDSSVEHPLGDLERASARVLLQAAPKDDPIVALNRGEDEHRLAVPRMPRIAQLQAADMGFVSLSCTT
jgi:hypothetical protein